MSAPVFVEEDWFPRPLPDNVVIGERSWLYSSFAFLHYGSERPCGLRVGRDTGIYQETFFDLGPCGEVVVGDYCTLAGPIFATNGRVVIGDYALISREVVFADAFSDQRFAVRREGQGHGSLATARQASPYRAAAVAQGDVGRTVGDREGLAVLREQSRDRQTLETVEVVAGREVPKVEAVWAGLGEGRAVPGKGVVPAFSPRLDLLADFARPRVEHAQAVPGYPGKPGLTVGGNGNVTDVYTLQHGRFNGLVGSSTSCRRVASAASRTPEVPSVSLPATAIRMFCCAQALPL
jgi:hypothetical protein